MNTIICENCNIDDCNKLCKMHIAKAFDNFLTNISTLETRIGEISYNEKTKKPEHISNGIELFHKNELTNKNDVTWLFSTIDNTTLAIGDKFKTVDGTTAFQLIRDYYIKTGRSREETEEITNKLRNINLNKLLITPFKPGTECEISIDDEDGIEQCKINGVIYSVKWRNNDETHKMEQTITFETNINKQKKIIKKSALDYIKEFTISKINIQARSNEKSKEFIEITSDGIIKPIFIKHNNYGIVIDGTYLYYVDNSKEEVIGYWDKNGKLEVKAYNNTEVIKYIEKYVNIFKCHRRYIAPYKLYESNTVNLK